MRALLFLLTVLFSSLGYGQFNYNEQRQKEADRYLESIKRGQQYTNTKSSGFKMNEQAVQEMTDMWKRRAGKKTTAQLEAERIANEKKWAENREEREAKIKAADELREKNAFLKEVASTIAQMNAPQFTRAGFSAGEANVLGMRWVGTVTINNEIAVREKYDEQSDRAIQAYSSFLKKENTANFEELMDLVADFDIAGYTAVKSLERIKKRFPEKKELIDVALPFHGINYWKELGEYTITKETETASAYLLGDDAQKAEMNNLLKSWIKAFPELLDQIYYSYGDNKTFKKLINDVVSKQDKSFLHDIALSAAIALRFYPPVIVKTTKDMPSLRQLLTFDDFEIIRNYHNLSGIKAIEKVIGDHFMTNYYNFNDIKKWESDLYTEELKKYADLGDIDAMNAYALLTLRGFTKDNKEAAYPYLKKAADGGLPYPLMLLREYKNLKQLGIENWGIYKRELEFKKQFNEQERSFIANAWGTDIPTFFGNNQPFPDDKKLKIIQPGKPDEIIYYYGAIVNGKANGFGYGIDPKDNLYSGYWKDNQYHGRGELQTGDGHSFEGLFANGKRNGYIKYNYLKKGNGKFHSGFYENDKLVRKVIDYRYLDGWGMVGNKYNWLFSDIPASYTNVSRTIDNRVLKFKKLDEGYNWSVVDLNNINYAAYSYDIEYRIDKEGYDNGSCGILIHIDEGNGSEKSKLLYMIHPGAKTYYLGLFNPNTKEWTPFTSPNANGGWVASNNIKGYHNRMRLDKLGDDIFIYLNGICVFTQNITASGKPLHRFTGIGIVQGGKISGTSPYILFK